MSVIPFIVCHMAFTFYRPKMEIFIFSTLTRFIISVSQLLFWFQAAYLILKVQPNQVEYFIPYVRCRAPYYSASVLRYREIWEWWNGWSTKLTRFATDDRQGRLRVVTANIYASIIVEARKGWRGWMQRERKRETNRDDFQANLIPTLIFLPRAELEDTSR